MRANDLIADAWIVVLRDGHDGLLPVGTPSLVKNMRDGLGAEGAALVRVRDRCVERGSTVEIEKAKET